MIDGLGRASPPRLALVGGDGQPRATAAASPVTSAAPRTTGSSAGQQVRDMAASPPVDSAKVAALKLAIASGSYKPDPQAIAAKMIALDTGRN